MSLRTPGLAVEIAVSNMDLYPYDLPGRPDWSANLEQLVPFLEQTGCANYEIHPTHTLADEVAALHKRGDDELSRTVVGSLHQTFNEGEGLFGRLADRRGLYRSLESVPAMTAIQRALGYPVVAVHYGEEDPVTRLQAGLMRIMPDYPGSFPVVQPKARMFQKFWAENNDDLLVGVRSRGFVGLCPDTVHSRCKQDGVAPPPLEAVWADHFSSGGSYQMHVSSGRYDVHWDPDVAARSVAEDKAFVGRDWRRARDTEMGDMIVGAIENWVAPRQLAQAVGTPVLRMVIERTPKPTAILRSSAQHARFVGNLVEIIKETGAVPLLWGDSVQNVTDLHTKAE